MNEFIINISLIKLLKMKVIVIKKKKKLNLYKTQLPII